MNDPTPSDTQSSGLTPEMHRRVRAIFDEAMERPESERLLFVDTACAGDQVLLAAVVRLLGAQNDSQGFLNSKHDHPQRIGRYMIVGELGRGAMGVVYEGLDPLIRRKVAVKVILLESLGTGREASFLRDRLFREAHSAGVLSHPGIVVVYDVGEENGTAFIAMERVEGPSLFQVLDSGKKVSPQDSLEILRQTASALDYAHRNQIVHRDIKPANIMIDKGRAVKVADFGIAKIQSTQAYTRTGMIMGTPSYMSPEQIEAKPLDGRSDQFSLAVIAYELLTGVKPFESDSLATLVHMIVYSERPSALKFNPSLPPAMDAVLRRALATSPEDRYPTCGEFIDALDAAWRGVAMPVKAEKPATQQPEPAAAVPPSPPPPQPPASVASAPGTRKITPVPESQPSPAAPVVVPPLPPPPVGAAPVAAKRGAPIALLLVMVLVFAGLMAGAYYYFFILPTKPTSVAVVPPVTKETPKTPPAVNTPPSNPSPVVRQFSASPDAVAAGASATLRWNVTDATTVSIDHGVGNVAPSGSADVKLSATTTYTLTAKGAGGDVSSTATINVSSKATAEPPKPPDKSARIKQLFDEAAAKKTAGQAAAAVALLKQAADLGDARSMNELGELYTADLPGLPENDEESVKWFRKAADLGNISGILNLGAAYALGSGVPADDSRAVFWYRKAADTGSAAGMFDLGTMYETGRGVNKDLSKATEYYQKAADLGHVEAKARLSKLKR